MEHVAILKKSWGLLEKILAGEKTIETRWRARRSSPWNKVKEGETIYFKDGGTATPIRVKAEVRRVIQFEDLKPEAVRGILLGYAKGIGGIDGSVSGFYERFKKSKYCVMVFIKNPQEVEPFYIDKRRAGFPEASAWLAVEDIKRIMVP